jgi:hypothetical protein
MSQDGGHSAGSAISLIIARPEFFQNSLTEREFLILLRRFPLEFHIRN